MSEVRYMLREARQGIRRNIGAAAATILIIFISLSIAGTAMLVKWGVDDAVDYMQSQVKIKLFIDPAADMTQLAAQLQQSGQFDTLEFETGPQMLDQMRQFFVGREYLFAAFQVGEIPGSITLGVRAGQDMDAVADSMRMMPNVVDVIYPQEFARTVLTWSRAIDWYGGATIAVLLIASFLTVCVAISLALHQRQKDIRIKLLLGAKESHVRAQFLFEGALLGFVDGVLATFVVYALYEFGLLGLQERLSVIFNFTATQLTLTIALVVLLGVAMGFVGSYFTTRRLIDNA